MKKLRWLTVALLLGAPLPSFGQANTPSSGKTPSGSQGANAKARSNENDQAQPVLSESQVLVKLHQANLMEMEAGGLAAARGQSAKVRKYGEQLIKDHRQADDTVKAFAKNNGIDLEANAGPSKGSDEGTGKDSDESTGEQPEQSKSASMDRLRTLNGAEFDDAFLTMMVSDHEDAIRMVRNARSQTRDAEFRALLNKLLPVLQQHHDLAQRLLNGTNSG